MTENDNVKERPILFSAPMIRALLAGTKTQTRRLLRVQPPAEVTDFCTFHNPNGEGLAHFGFDPVERALQSWFAVCPFGQVGDRLWVREAHYVVGEFNQVFYRADGSNSLGDGLQWSGKWKPVIHMFRRHSRILLEVTDVRVERLQDISENDCWAEGIEEVMHDFDTVSQCMAAKRIGACIDDAKPLYMQLWESINGPGSWDLNPFVWAVSFMRIEA